MVAHDAGHLVTVSAAVPFTNGVVLGTAPAGSPAGGRESGPAALVSNSVLKTPWGLVAGSFASGARTVLARCGGPLTDFSVDAVAAALACLQRAGGWGAAATWLLSYEPGPAGPESPGKWLGAPVAMYRYAGGGLAAARWGMAAVRGPAEAEVVREGERRLHWALDRGVDLDTRLSVLLDFFGWMAERIPSVTGDVEVGLHEAGHRFAVDRLRP